MIVAILGANGFIGYRLFETWQKSGPHAPRAIVRSPAGLARIARFAADWRLADATEERTLAAALAGCDAVVHCVVGDPRLITAAIEPVYRAARQAGIRKLVYLSSAAVHGLHPPAGTDERSPLNPRQTLAYNNAKIRAEARLQQLARDRAVATVILRPGIVFGPRSRWVADVADAICTRSAWWIDGGRGVCNSLCVDNLVHAVEQALAAPDCHGEAYLLGDRETVAWRDLYLGIARAFGVGEDAFREAVPASAARTWRDRLGRIKATPAAQSALAWFSPRLKAAVNGALAGWQPAPAPDPWALPVRPAPSGASLEMTQLFACRTKLPHARAEAQLGYQPPVTFAEGLRRSTEWLAQAGYPVVDSPRV
jgi:nucleoside-diphosphate-sugar epimerase